MVSGEDDLFRRAMRDVKPLKQRTPRFTSQKAPASRQLGATKAQSHKQTPHPRSVASAAPPLKPRAPALQHGDTAGLDRRTGQRFKRGQLPVEARLDLHGMTQDVAHNALNAFIEDSWRAGKRCVLVITGKGSRSKNKENPYQSENLGILKYSVPEYIKSNYELNRVIKDIKETDIEDISKGSFDIFLKKFKE